MGAAGWGRRGCWRLWRGEVGGGWVLHTISVVPMFFKIGARRAKMALRAPSSIASRVNGAVSSPAPGRGWRAWTVRKNVSGEGASTLVGKFFNGHPGPLPQHELTHIEAKLTTSSMCTGPKPPN